MTPDATRPPAADGQVKEWTTSIIPQSCTDVLAAAVYYAERGWSVFPLRPRSKQPAVRWGACQRCAAPADRVFAYWRANPDHGVAIVTGRVSGLWVVDIDPLHGGEDSLADLEAEHGRLPDTVECLTGGGGRHLYYRYGPGGRIPNRTGLLPGIDVRGDGGYVVAPPSIHPETGRAYEWEASSHPADVAIADAPTWLLDMVAGDLTETGKIPTPPDEWRRLTASGVAEGARNNTVARLAGHLLRTGVDPYVTLELLLGWNQGRCRPPLPADELRRTVDSIAGRELKRRGGGRRAG